MNLVWQRFTLSSVPLKEYLRGSLLYRSVFGVLGSWRQGSILLQWGDAIAAALLSLVYALAPFVSTTLIGLMLVACVGFWLHQHSQAIAYHLILLIVTRILR
ncbi:MAG: putative bicarbonate transporter, IctB family, partial [Cyanobacteria bacterium J06639_18]